MSLPGDSSLYTTTSGFHSFTDTNGYNVKLNYLLYKPNDSAAAARVPLIFLCGRSRVKEDWYELPGLCAPHRPLLIFDPRGLGGSTYVHPDDEYQFEFSMNDLAFDAVALAKAIFPNNPKFHWFGISMGGFMCQIIAHNNPETVQSLVIGCSAPHSVLLRAPPGTALHGEALFKYWAIRTLSKRWVENNKERFDKIFKLEMSRNRPEMAMLAQILATESFQIQEENVRAIKAPALIMHGDEDDAINHEKGVLLNSYISGSEFHTLKGCGHNFWLMEPNIAGELINQFTLKQD